MKSSLEAINEMWNGYKVGDVHAIYARANVGKTLLGLQEVYWLASQGQNVYWIDTEGGAEEMWQKWSGVWAKRFGDLKGVVKFVRIATLVELLGLLDISATVEYSKKGKVTVSVHARDGRRKNRVYEDMVKHIEDGVLVIDSLTMPIKASIPTANENYPARASAIYLVLGKVLSDVHACRAICIVTHHATYNPALPYSAHRGEVWGSSSIEYFSKRIMALEKPMNKALEDYRRLWCVRSPVHKSLSKSYWVKIGDSGYIDVTEDEVEEVLSK